MGAELELGAVVADCDRLEDHPTWPLLDRTAQYRLVATTLEGTPLDSFPFERRSIVAVGNERRGVAGWLPAWDAGVAIPQRGEGQSLNASVAGGIVMYALMQRLVSP